MNQAIRLALMILLQAAAWGQAAAQEYISPLANNPRACRDLEKSSKLQALKSTADPLLEIPFFEDFSERELVLNASRWSDQEAFVNNNFCLDPVSNGVATLDALDSAGSIYANASISPITFEADHLSSRAINLEYPASDSIYFSFYYQPGGLCDLPEPEDSLLLDFWVVDSSRWINVWSAPGSELKAFQQVMIPVKEERFLVPGFRFRFRNMASLSRSQDYPDKRSNADYWHLDYIRLGRQRNATDTVIRDVAFSTPVSSMLKNLSSLPWSHFEAAYNTTLSPFLSVRYRNNDSISRNLTRTLIIEEPYYQESQTAGTPTAQDLPAGQDTVVDFSYIYPLNFNRGDSALILFKASLRTDEFDPKINDTVYHEQFFGDYYAYDDGTPEAGYGLRGSGTSNGLVAMKYFAYEPDRLGGVYIYFNQVYDSINLKNYTFNLMVWGDDNGRPGPVLWNDEVFHRPIYTSGYTGFIKYEFTEPVDVDGPFYVGWRQYKEFSLNMGLDLNSESGSDFMYYNLGSWLSSSAPGVLMFRPFLYDPGTGRDEEQTGSRELRCYPNPARDRVYIDLPSDIRRKAVQLLIHDTSGRLVRAQWLDQAVFDVSGLKTGLYFLQLRAGSERYHSKLVISP